MKLTDLTIVLFITLFASCISSRVTTNKVGGDAIGYAIVNGTKIRLINCTVDSINCSIDNKPLSAIVEKLKAFYDIDFDMTNVRTDAACILAYKEPLEFWIYVISIMTDCDYKIKGKTVYFVPTK